MIESQSVTMDAIAGATVSSNAIKTAVEACLVQSIEAAGGDKNSIQAFYTTGEKIMHQLAYRLMCSSSVWVVLVS